MSNRQLPAMEFSLVSNCTLISPSHLSPWSAKKSRSPVPTFRLWFMPPVPTARAPLYLYDVLQASLSGTVKGIQVANVWRSDSGEIGDLNQVAIREQVQPV